MQRFRININPFILFLYLDYRYSPYLRNSSGTQYIFLN